MNKSNNNYKCNAKLSIYKTSPKILNYNYNSLLNSMNSKKQKSLNSGKKKNFSGNIPYKNETEKNISNSNFDKVLNDYLEKYKKMAPKLSQENIQEAENNEEFISYQDYEMKQQKMKIIFDNFLEFPDNDNNTKILDTISDDYDGFYILKNEKNSKDYEIRLNYCENSKKDSDFNENHYENELDESDDILNKGKNIDKDKISEHSNENENENKSNEDIKNNENDKENEKPIEENEKEIDKKDENDKNENEKENNKLELFNDVISSEYKGNFVINNFFGDMEEKMKKEEAKRINTKNNDTKEVEEVYDEDLF